MGTNDSGATDSDPTGGAAGKAAGNNMVEITSSAYDADDNLVSTASSADANTSYTTYYQYDWRDRQTGTVGPDGVATIDVLDNLDRSDETDTYAHAAYNASTGLIVDATNTTVPVTDPANAQHLRGKTVTSYDNAGQVYESQVYEVDPQYGTVGDYLPTFTWYDQGGNVVKTQTGGTVSGTGASTTWTGAFQKFAYDNLGQCTAEYDGCELTGETTAALLNSVANGQLDLGGESIVQQNQTWYDAAGDAVASATYERFPGDLESTATGALTAGDSYVTASATWYDGIGRQTATANFGREDTAAGTETRHLFDGSGNPLLASDGVPSVVESGDGPFQPYTSNVADSSGDSYIVSLTAYDAAGQPYQTTDNLGRIDETLYDAAGRVTRTIQDYVPAGFSNGSATGNVLPGDTADDVTVDNRYDSAGRLFAMVAYNATGSAVQQQTTTYLYGSAVNASWQTGVIYPDASPTGNFQKITSLTRNGATATATVANSGYAANQWVCISGANEAGYDGWVQVASVSASGFTFVLPAGAPLPPPSATGNIQVRALPTTDANGPDVTTTDYDRLGRQTVFSDQRGVTHQYTYDTAGRLSANTVTSLGPASDPTRAVDGSVLQIATAYNDMGRVATVTSYADVAGTSPVNQVEYVYNGWGTVDSEYQEPNGLVGPISSTTSVYVQYDYDDGSYTDPKGATAASYLRLDLVWYPANPNGGGSNFVNYLYRLDPSDGTIDNMMSRVDDIETTGVNDLMFRYLGASTLATEDLADLDIELDYSAHQLHLDGHQLRHLGPLRPRAGPALGQLWERVVRFWARQRRPGPLHLYLQPGRQRDERGQPAEHQLQPDLYLQCPQSPHLQHARRRPCQSDVGPRRSGQHGHGDDDQQHAAIPDRERRQ